MMLTYALPATEQERITWPGGYWYASAVDGGYDAVGNSPESALAALVMALEEAGVWPT